MGGPPVGALRLRARKFHPSSDLDFWWNLRGGRWRVFGLRSDLEAVFGRSVDLVCQRRFASVYRGRQPMRTTARVAAYPAAFLWEIRESHQRSGVVGWSGFKAYQRAYLIPIRGQAAVRVVGEA